MRGELETAWAKRDPRRYASAESAYRQAVALAPNVATYHTALGLLLVERGRLESGLAELERAAALDATDPLTHATLSELYLVLGREAEAASARAQAIRWSRE